MCMSAYTGVWEMSLVVEETVETLKALADPTRLRLVSLLHGRGERCVCELEAELDLPQYTVSRHLGILRRAGILAAERDGIRVMYRIAGELEPDLLALLDAAVRLAGPEPVAA